VNLACYTARYKDSRARLEQAFALGNAKKLKLVALDDPDLQPLWANIAET